MNTYFSTIKNLINFTIIILLISCKSTKEKNDITISAKRYEHSLKVIYDDVKNNDTPIFLIPIKIRINNASLKNKRLLFTRFSPITFTDNTIHEVSKVDKHEKLIKKPLTYLDTVIVQSKEIKEYIVFPQVDVYMNHYPNFDWSSFKERILNAKNDTLIIRDYDSLSKKYPELAKRLKLDTIKVYFNELKIDEVVTDQCIAPIAW